MATLFGAELQFRLASAVRLASTLKTLPLDLPSEWAHGQHRVTYEEIALRPDQADVAAHLLHQSAHTTLGCHDQGCDCGCRSRPEGIQRRRCPGLTKSLE